MPEKIYFYTSKEPYFEFSNFYEFEFSLNDESWKSVEHCYQAAKFESGEYRRKIQSAETPMDARLLGQSKEFAIRKNWDSIKEEIMLVALRGKFAVPSLKDLLVSTAPAMLVEKSPHDNYWGAGKSGNGRNRLGVLLMQLRAELSSSGA